jgi:hypothetical protein
MNAFAERPPGPKGNSQRSAGRAEQHRSDQE